MKLKLICLGAILLAVGLYFVLQGIKMNRENVIFSYSSEREKSTFIVSLFSIMQIAFTNNYRVYLISFLIGIIPLTLFAVYIVFSRINDVKYTIYNIKEEIYKEVILNTLAEKNIEFTITDDFIVLKGTSTYIEYIYKGILIKRCKKLPDYKQLLLSLENNIKNVKYQKKKKEWLSTIIFGVVLIVAAIVVFVVAFR